MFFRISNYEMNSDSSIERSRRIMNNRRTLNRRVEARIRAEASSMTTRKKTRELERRFGFRVPRYGTPNEIWERALDELDGLI